MQDLISRQAAIDFIAAGHLCNPNEPRWSDNEVVNFLKSRPSAQRTGRWIPVSERLPEDGTWNIFTDGKQVSIERYKMDAIDHFFPAGRFFELEDAVAWIPLPEPYKEVQE